MLLQCPREHCGGNLLYLAETGRFQCTLCAREVALVVVEPQPGPAVGPDPGHRTPQGVLPPDLTPDEWATLTVAELMQRTGYSRQQVWRRRQQLARCPDDVTSLDLAL